MELVAIMSQNSYYIIGFGPYSGVLTNTVSG